MKLNITNFKKLLINNINLISILLIIILICGLLLINNETKILKIIKTAKHSNNKIENFNDYEPHYRNLFIDITIKYKSYILGTIRNNIINHTYLQYTATPQGPLLISILDILSNILSSYTEQLV